ncbi:MAG: hypothetical protein Q8K10_05750, partial [Methylobacter sp.]|nr:hypothetical protein [Methylobacter sp.]
KFNANPIESEEQRWLKFFKEGEQLNDSALPDWMSTQEMKQAMSTLSIISEKERRYHQYQSRQESLREQRTIQLELEQTSQALTQAQQREQLALLEKQAALQEKEAALAEIERLKALLAKKNH